ncbi:hypothetical protein B0W48_01760 [Pseudoalteromonas aliena]|uniref:Uncharacterized protein n=1 Tax=Pseudoalteromonas aliena TaxID=247523 RepID=A0A1Q2GU42_9GAMM|nr:hypothetical protein [Pseudoalteromonas aliena]AQP98634.1 hypothetical protein B0W48_01760 [Pseudoalteromonas aliena]
MNRYFIGRFFFLIAIVLMVITEIYLTLIFKEFILAGKGLGVYGVLLYFVVMIVSSLLWLLSYRISKNRAQAAIFLVCGISAHSYCCISAYMVVCFTY